MTKTLDYKFGSPDFPDRFEKYSDGTVTDTMTDLTKCPNCGGEADNGHDREDPPTAYNCTKCDALERLKDITNLASNYSPDVYYETIQESYQIIRQILIERKERD